MTHDACGPVMSVILLLALIIMPCIFGWRITVLQDEIADIRASNVTSVTAMRAPIDTMTCSSKSAVSVSTRADNVQVFNLSSVSPRELSLEVDRLQRAYIGNSDRRACTCSAHSELYLTNITKTRLATTYETGLDCKPLTVPSNATVFLYPDGSVGRKSPKAQIESRQQDIGGFFVGIFICCGILGFVMFASVLFVIIKSCIQCCGECPKVVPLHS